METKVKLDNILSHFKIQGGIEKIVPFGNGHINDSYRVVNTQLDQPDYLLQRINHHVFKDVDGMMQNIEAVTDFLKKRYEREGIQSIHERVLSLVKTTGDKLFVLFENEYWRLYVFMKTLKSLDIPDSNDEVYQGARAFGQFIADLFDFDAVKLNTTIPHFHHVPHRINQFKQSLDQWNKSFTPDEKVEIDYVMGLKEEMSRIQHQLDLGQLPLRVTHNDTKFNNVLYNKANHISCVIDLDTVMPGTIHFDFGDGVRTGTTTCAEDERDLSLVDVDLERFDVFTKGFLDPLKNVITKEEIELLPLSAAMLPYIMGVRFLTDHFNGNIYYKVKYGQHNFDRARNQLQLCRKMLLRRVDLTRIVEKYANP